MYICDANNVSEKILTPCPILNKCLILSAKWRESGSQNKVSCLKQGQNAFKMNASAAHLHLAQQNAGLCAEKLINSNSFILRACLHKGGGPQIGEVTRLSI